MKQKISPPVASFIRLEIVRQLAGIFASLKTIQDVSVHLKCHERTFRRNRRKWGFPKPAINEGNFIRWTPEQITSWERSRTNGR
jgi:hypothetical protein